MNTEKESSNNATKDDNEERRLRDLLKARQEKRRQFDEPTEESKSGFTTVITKDSSAGMDDVKNNNATLGTTTISTKDETLSASTQPSSQQDQQLQQQHHQQQQQDEQASRSHGSRQSSDNSKPTTQQKARGRRRRRERRRMNREARRAGGAPPPQQHYDNRSYHGRPQQYGYGGGGHGSGYDGRWERSPPPDNWRGPPPSWSLHDYHASYQHRHGHDGPLSRSSGGTGNSRNSDNRRSRSRSFSRSRSSRSAESSSGHSRSGSRSRSSSGRGRAGRKGSSDGSRRNDKRSSRDRTDPSNSKSRSERKSSRSSSSRDQYRRSRRRRSRSESSSESSSSSSSSLSTDELKNEGKQATTSSFSRDQQTVFVTQLVMRATEKDIRRYFRRKVGCKVNEVILLKDKRTGRHKGSAYVQVGRIEDVSKAVAVSGQAPDFQRFPLLVKASEAEKNYVIPASSSTLTASMMGTSTPSGPMLNKDGKLIESQKVYVGSLDPSVTEEHLFALFSQFGQLEKVSMQLDPVTRQTRGYCFISFRDPKEANLAIQTMSNQLLAGRPMKTGWANQASSVPGVQIVTSDEFPSDASVRAQKAYTVLAQLTGSGVAAVSTSAVSPAISSVAEEAINVAMGMPTTELSNANPASSPTVQDAQAAAMKSAEAAASGAGPIDETMESSENSAQNEPTNTILVHNVYNKDIETGSDWVEEIQEEFLEECSKFGKLEGIKVMSKEEGGKIYARFKTIDAAKTCATNLEGRWFDKRQLQVEYVKDEDAPTFAPPVKPDA